MAGKKQPKKRTNREIVNAIMDLNQRVQHSIEYTNEGADPKDLPADTADKGSGTAGVRKK